MSADSLSCFNENGISKDTSEIEADLSILFSSPLLLPPARPPARPPLLGRRRLDPALAQDEQFLDMLPVISGWPASVVDLLQSCRAPAEEVGAHAACMIERSIAAVWVATLAVQDRQRFDATYDDSFCFVRVLCVLCWNHRLLLFCVASCSFDSMLDVRIYRRTSRGPPQPSFSLASG